jgi:hypothetical protein
MNQHNIPQHIFDKIRAAALKEAAEYLRLSYKGPHSHRYNGKIMGDAILAIANDIECIPYSTVAVQETDLRDAIHGAWDKASEGAGGDSAL